MEFFTIGVYHTTEAEFFAKLTDNHIDTFCDIRQRRGVRGSQYAFVNSQRLQQRLDELDIRYGHVERLAPTKEIREMQQADDARKGILKSERRELGPVFANEYEGRILDNFDLDAFVDQLDEHGASRVALFCVEQHPAACHRSLVAKRLHQKGYTVKDL
jgi:uncharacterized protein (DUF488 family)